MATKLALQGKWLITGGAGFLGRAIMDRAELEEWDCQFTVYSRDEQKQDYVSRRFRNASCILGDIRNADRLRLVATGHDGCIHAGALKYIPQAEFNATECMEINTLGSRSVIEACRGIVPMVLAISTDKAVMPLNVYGATKMLMERLFIEADYNSGWTRYGVIRYGNVLGSTGSIVPVFKAQARTGEVTITDPSMTRFWLSIDQAVELVLQGVLQISNSQEVVENRGVITIPKAGGLDVGSLVAAMELEVPTREIGRRPGEKMSEDLLSPYEVTKISGIDEQFIHIQPLRMGDAYVTEDPVLANGFNSSRPYYQWTDHDVRVAIQQAEAI